MGSVKTQAPRQPARRMRAWVRAVSTAAGAATSTAMSVTESTAASTAASTAVGTAASATATASCTARRARITDEGHRMRADVSAAPSPVRAIRGEGTAESHWLGWPGLRALPRRQLREWLPAGVRLVVIAPHPDDEILGGGGLLAEHVAQGGAAAVVAVTDGEASHGGGGAHVGRLAARRRRESASGLARLGVAGVAVHRLGLPDGGVAQHVDGLARVLAALLRPSDVALSTWRLDGHPDHEASGAAAAQACAAAACRLLEAPVWMWHWAAPGDARVPWEHLCGFSVPMHVRAAKEWAIAAHATQLEARGQALGPVLGRSVLARAVRDTEYFFV